MKTKSYAGLMALALFASVNSGPAYVGPSKWGTLVKKDTFDPNEIRKSRKRHNKKRGK